jgi:hypothetical protein
VPGADAQVAIQHHNGLAAIGQGTLTAALAEADGHVQVQVEVAELKVGQLATTAPVSSRNMTMAASRRASKSLPAQAPNARSG